MFRIILLTLVSGALADSAFSQGHIKYSDGSGTRVDWKLYAPYSQFKSHLREYHRRDSAKSLPEQSQIIQPTAQTPAEISAKSSEPRYKPLLQVPQHLKQLLTQSYGPQAPYVNPDAFFHRIPQLSFGEVIPRKSDNEPMEYQSRPESRIVRPQDQRGQQQQHQLEQEGRIYAEEKDEIQRGRNQSPVPLVPHSQSLSFDKSVPLEIQQLLQYQAEIPYNVIANHIIYKPEVPFVPEPLLEDEVGPYKYRTRVYYAVKNDTRTNKAQEYPAPENRNRE